MSTELFRKYINIINEVSQDEITQLTLTLEKLETVLAKYKNKIRESLKNRAHGRLLEIDLSQMSREEIEALRQGGSRSTVSQAELDALRAGGSTNPIFNPPRASGSSLGSKIKSGSGKLARYAGYATMAYEILSHVYDYLMKTDLTDLDPKDQAIIKDNIPVLQAWLAPDKFEILDRYPSLRIRLLNTVDLLGKLGMSLKSQPAAATPAQPASAPAADKQSLEKLLNKAQFNEYYQAALKQIISENMHLFSEAEKMAVHRDLVSEDLSDYAAWLYPHKGSAVAAGLAGAGTGALAWAQKQANKQAAEKAAGDAAGQAAADALAAEQENARITAQNDADMRQWRRTGRAAGDPRPTPAALKPVPTIPRVEPSELGAVRRAAAKVAPTSIAKWAAKHPGWAGLGAATISGLAWMYNLVATPVSQAVGVKAGLDSIQSGLKSLAKTSPKNDYLELFKYLTDHPDEYKNADDATKKMIDQKQLDFCNNYPDEEGCSERKKEICQDYNNELPGCKLG
jgi:hypothetical protein